MVFSIFNFKELKIKLIDPIRNWWFFTHTYTQRTSNIYKANEFYELGCNFRNGLGCYNLAKNYQRNLGVKEDIAKTKELLNLACDYGFQKACIYLERSSKKHDTLNNLHDQILKNYPNCCEVTGPKVVIR